METTRITFTAAEVDALLDRVSSGWEVSDETEFWEPLLRKVEAAQRRLNQRHVAP